jgi:hypothetical protein
MTEYYKTQKGYCYKKTQKGGSTRISNEDYNKEINKSGGSKNNKKLQKNIKIDIKYHKKTNKKGNKYYLKVDKNGKQFRISKDEYNKNVLKGGVKRNTSNNNSDSKCWDSVNIKYKDITKYLEKDPKNFVTEIKAKHSVKYYCQNIDELLVSLSTTEKKFVRNDYGRIVGNETYQQQYIDRDSGESLLKEFYECKKSEPAYLRPREDNIIKHTKYIKFPPYMQVVKKPDWLNNRGFQTSPGDKNYYRVFSIIPTNQKVNALASTVMVHSNDANATSSDHCNQIEPVIIYSLEQLKEHPKPPILNSRSLSQKISSNSNSNSNSQNTPQQILARIEESKKQRQRLIARAKKQRPPTPPPVPINRLVINENGWANSRRRTIPSQVPPVLPSFLGRPSQPSSRPSRILEPRTPSPPPRPTSPPLIRPRYIARRTGDLLETRPTIPPQQNNSNATTEENN